MQVGSRGVTGSKYRQNRSEQGSRPMALERAPKPACENPDYWDLPSESLIQEMWGHLENLHFLQVSH